MNNIIIDSYKVTCHSPIHRVSWNQNSNKINRFFISKLNLLCYNTTATRQYNTHYFQLSLVVRIWECRRALHVVRPVGYIRTIHPCSQWLRFVEALLSEPLIAEIDCPNLSYRVHHGKAPYSIHLLIQRPYFATVNGSKSILKTPLNLHHNTSPIHFHGDVWIPAPWAKHHSKIGPTCAGKRA